MLALSMLLGSFTIHAGAEIEGSMSEELKSTVELLRTLEIIPDYYDYNVNIEDKVTRADFASSVAKLINCTSYTGNPYYYDVPQTHWAYNEICSLTRLGVLSGDSEKLFSPDRTITKNEAYKIIMTILGYGVAAESMGGYPSGYLAEASRAGITDGVSANADVTLADMFIILYNSLTAPVMKNTSFRPDATYEVDENDSILSMYRNIYYDRGKVTGADGVSLDGSELYANRISIDYVQYGSDIDLSSYLGEEIEFFYHSDTQSGENNIIWARLTGKTEILNLSIYNSASFDKTNYTLTYTVDGRNKTIDISRSCVLIYNGQVANSNISDILNMPKYEIKLIASDGGDYDTIIVDAYENYMVKSINENTFTVYDKLVDGRTLSLNEGEYTRFSLKLLGTKDMEFSELAENNILSVYRSLDGDIISVSVSAESISGDVQSTTNDEYGGMYITVNSTEYYMSAAAVEQSPITPTAGRTVKLYLDITGDVAYCEITDAVFSPMYLTKAWIDDEGGEVLYFEYLNSAGQLVKSKCTTRLTIDSVLYKNMYSAYEKFIGDNGKCKPQFVLGKLNGDGDITSIDTVRIGNGGTDDVLSVSIPYKSGLMYKSDGLLNTYGVIDSTTFIFSVPLDNDIESAEDYEFKVIDKTEIPNDSTLNFETYKTKDRVGFEQYLVIKGSSGATLSTSEMPILVDSFSSVVNDEGEIVECLTGWQGATRLSINSDGNYSFTENGIANSDVIRVYKNGTGEVTNAVMCFDYSENLVSGAAPTFNALYSTAVGYINDVVDDVVRIGYTAPETVDITLFGTNVPILICDSQNTINGKPEIYKGTLNDARTYMNSGSECSKIFVVQTRSAPKMFIIYN